MNLLKELKKLKIQHILLLVGVVVCVLYVTNYSSRLGSLFSGMTNSKTNSEESLPDNSNEVNPAMPAGMNSGPGEANGLQTITGAGEATSGNSSTNPADLLPKDNNNQWGNLNPNGSDELSNVNLLKAGFHAGVDTVGSTLRNANLQIRSEPANPKNNPSPWNTSTIESDNMRRGLEIGCGN